MHRRTVQDPQHTSSSTPHGAVRGTVAKLALALVTAGAALLALAPPGGAQSTGCADDDGPVVVIEVDGLIDPVLADLIDDQAARAEDACALALVLQFDSGGAVVSDDELDGLVATIEGSSVPVGVWIGPSGSKATGGAVRIVAAAAHTGIAPGSSIEVTPALLAARGVDAADLGAVDVGDRVGAQRAVDLLVADEVMTPRPDVITIQADDTVDKVLQMLASGHARFPVVGRDVDDIVGVVGLNNILRVPHHQRASTPVRQIADKAILLPRTMPLPKVLQALREQHRQLAVVVDEYGGFAGVITFEDVAEENLLPINLRQIDPTFAQEAC